MAKQIKTNGGGGVSARGDDVFSRMIKVTLVAIK